MRSFSIILAGALGGALIAVALIFAAAASGWLPQGAANGATIRAYLLGHPELIAEMSQKLQIQQQADEDKAQAAAVKKLGMATFFDPKLAFVTGPADAKNSVVEFYDYDCPYCRASLPTVEKFFGAHKNDTRFSFIEFPLPSLHGPGAVLAAKASLAARRQPDRYLAFHFALMHETEALDAPMIFADAAKAGLDIDKLKSDMNDPAIDKTIAASHDLARKAGIDGTPTFIVNGVMHPGAVDDETLAGYVKQS